MRPTSITQFPIILLLAACSCLVAVEPENYGENASRLRIHMKDLPFVTILEAISRQIEHQINIDVRLSRICTTGRTSVDWNATDWVKSINELCQDIRTRVIADAAFEIGHRDDVFVRPEILEMNGRNEVTIRLEIRRTK